MRATMIAVGTRGDVQPCVALGVALQAAGHEATVATHECHRDLVVDHGLAFAPVAEGEVSRGTDTERGQRWVEGRSRWMPWWVGMLEDARSVAQQRLSDCWAATADADLIIASNLGTLLALQMSTLFGVPLVRAYYGPAGWPGRPVGRHVVWQATRPFVNHARQGLGLPPLRVMEPFTELDDLGVPMLYGYSPAVAPPDPDGEEWATATGYWLLDDGDERPPEPDLLAFIDDGPPPVLISFGTNIDLDPEATVRLLVGALERAGQRGILVHSRFPELRDQVPDIAYLTDFVSFDWLFPRVTAVVHHGGAGTTGYGLRAGVPTVVVPYFADHHFWADRVAALGVGPEPIPRKKLTAESLASAIRQAATDVEMRRRASELGERLRAEDGATTAVELIERHVAACAHSEEPAPVGTRRVPACPVCGGPGSLAYHDTRDPLVGIPGRWTYQRCDRGTCGALWLDPAPREEEIGSIYRSTYYTHGDETPPSRAKPAPGLLDTVRRAHLTTRFGYDFDEPAGPMLRAVVDGALRLVPGGRDAADDLACHLPVPSGRARFLEIGFGSGDRLVRMAELGWDVAGVDIDAAAVAAVAARGVKAFAGTLEDQGFADGAFDAVYMSHVIEHVHDPIALLAECRRILAPGGRVVVITPNASSWLHHRYQSAWFSLQPPFHLVLFAPAALRTAFEQAGLAPLTTNTSARIAYVNSIGSLDIRDTNRVTSFDGRVPLGRLARGLATQLRESAMLVARPDAGEELIFVGAKG